MKILRLLAVTVVPMLLVLPMAQMQTAQDAVGRHNGVQNNGHVTDAEFDAAQDAFMEQETPENGLGPTFNANACSVCHDQAGIGGGGTEAELRSGRFDGATFRDFDGGSLVHTQCAGLRGSADNDVTDGDCEHPNTTNNVFALRRSLSIFGDGFVEAIANQTLQANVAAQPAAVRGTLINVPVAEVPGTTRVGRFGWKDQQASLESFAGDAYLNEMGITNCVDGNCVPFGTENRCGQGGQGQPNAGGSPGTGRTCDDGVDDPEDEGEDVELFTTFMRSLPVPARGPITADVTAGQAIFNNIGCDDCHTAQFTTVNAGTAINQGAEIVSAALGNKTIRPFGDFALHNINTGDGIVQNGGAGTRNQIRTKPLWGTRTQNRFLHDGSAFTLNDAILRHGGQATTARNAYNALGNADKARVTAFLISL
jgi:CxxC motif-containing protein (DUF1111 family)